METRDLRVRGAAALASGGAGRRRVSRQNLAARRRTRSIRGCSYDGSPWATVDSAGDPWPAKDQSEAPRNRPERKGSKPKRRARQSMRTGSSVFVGRARRRAAHESGSYDTRCRRAGRFAGVGSCFASAGGALASGFRTRLAFSVATRSVVGGRGWTSMRWISWPATFWSIAFRSRLRYSSSCFPDGIRSWPAR
jgi:hypothetical protein